MVPEKGRKSAMAKKSTTKNARMGARSNARRTGMFEMRNDRERKMFAMIAMLAVALLGSVGVAVAAFSQDLNINGTANIKATNWNIHFENLQAVALVGKASEVTAPTIDTNTTKIGDYAVELKAPGDATSYTFDVKNDGDLDAEITAITIKTGAGLTCTSTGANATANSAVCGKLNYTLKNADNSDVAVGDELSVGASKTLTLKLEFDGSATDADLPDQDVAVSGLDVTITYGQKNN